ncbi:MAG: hypothetical protein WEB89_09210 [Balneolales bacterium]
MSKTRHKARKHKRRRKGEQDKPMLFSLTNYYILLVSFLMVLTGFVAMYLENLEKGIISLYISPIFIVAGFALVVIAILKTDQKEVASDLTEPSASDR